MTDTTSLSMHHPLQLLDDFLASLPPLSLSSSAIDDVNSKTLDDDEKMTRRQDLVLRVADELLGYDCSSGGSAGYDRGSTLLENALALLDNKLAQSQAIGNDGKPVAWIRRIRAKRSGREAILFRKQRGSKTTTIISSSAEHPIDSNGNIVPDEYYLCLLPRLRNRRGFECGSGIVDIRGGVHCTCRSFFQNVLGGRHGGRRHCQSRHVQISSSLNAVVTCKHILAAKLMPHLLLSGSDGTDENEFETVDDRLFAKLLSQASIG